MNVGDPFLLATSQMATAVRGLTKKEAADSTGKDWSRTQVPGGLAGIQIYSCQVPAVKPEIPTFFPIRRPAMNPPPVATTTPEPSLPKTLGNGPPLPLAAWLRSLSSEGLTTAATILTSTSPGLGVGTGACSTRTLKSLRSLKPSNLSGVSSTTKRFIFSGMFLPAFGLDLRKK